MVPSSPSVAFGSTRDYAAAHPDVMLSFARAYSRGVARFKMDRDLSVKAYQKYLEIDDQSILQDTWDEFREQLSMPPVVTPAGLQNAIADTRKVLRSAMQGKGLVATLLNDQQLASDLHALITNLRAHGVLFYRDSAATTQTKPPEQTKRARQSPSR